MFLGESYVNKESDNYCNQIYSLEEISRIYEKVIDIEGKLDLMRGMDLVEDFVDLNKTIEILGGILPFETNFSLDPLL